MLTKRARIADRDAKVRIRKWREDPVFFVQDAFEVEEIDEWQKDVLKLLTWAPRIAMMACKGPGKSCVLAWANWWMMACHKDHNGIVLSITGDNLKDGLWKELAVWYDKSPLLKSAFEVTATRITNRERPKTWWLSARTFPANANKEAQADTLAGLHRKFVSITLDEVGSMPIGVLPAAEGIFANIGIEGGRVWLLAAGNPTSRQGALYRICKKDAALWQTVSITGDPEDPKRSPRISMVWAQSLIDEWGRDNPHVQVNVLGEFPASGSEELIDIDKVMRAQKRDLPALAYQSDPIIWGLDPARSGKGDEIALMRRQGVLARRAITWRGLDGVQLASKISMLLHKAEEDDELPDAVFVDVGGVGCSCYDHLHFLGWGAIVHQVDFGWAASNKKYQNKRVEMWWEMAIWIHKDSSCLPDDNILQSELCAPTCEYKIVGKRTVFTVESKESMKARGMESPNRGDALALTFAEPMAKTGRRHRRDLASETRGGDMAEHDYNPLA